MVFSITFTTHSSMAHAQMSILESKDGAWSTIYIGRSWSKQVSSIHCSLVDFPSPRLHHSIRILDERCPFQLDREVFIAPLVSMAAQGRRRRRKRCSWFSMMIISQEQPSRSAYHDSTPPTRFFTSPPRSSRPPPTHSLRLSHTHQSSPLLPLFPRTPKAPLRDSSYLSSRPLSTSVKTTSSRRPLD